MRAAVLQLGAALLIYAVGGCSTAAGIPEPAPLAACGAANSAALIDISMRNDIFHSAPYTRVEASVGRSAPPDFHRVVAEEGACRYLATAFGDCSPACAAGEFCLADGRCAAAAEPVSAGTLVIEGLTASVEVEPASWNPGSYTGPSGLPAPAFAPGARVTATFSGGRFPPAALSALGVAPMDTTLTESGLDLDGAGDLEVLYEPGDDPAACVQLVLNGKNPAHGAPIDDIIVCDGLDTGVLVVPRALLNRFPRGSTPDVTNGFDWPHSELTRYTHSVQETHLGVAELRLRSTTLFQLRYP